MQRFVSSGEIINILSCVCVCRDDVWQKIVHAIVGLEESNRASPIRPSLAVGFIVTILAHGLL